MAVSRRERIELVQSSVVYVDQRLEGFDAAAVLEVIEHIESDRLRAFERILFERNRPRTIVVTTPNREYNMLWPALRNGALRHADHRFEWTRAQFGEWASTIAARYGYEVSATSIGDVDATLGSPTQMAVFRCH